MKKSKMETSPKMLQIMTDLGCKEVTQGIFTHPDIKYKIDLTGTNDSSIMYVLFWMFWWIGHDDYKEKLKKFIGE